MMVQEEDGDASTPAEGNEEDLDFGALKKKKKKKKNMAEFEAELAEQDGTDTTGAAEEKKQGGEEAWLNSDRDYQYEEVKRAYLIQGYNDLYGCNQLLGRVFKILRQNNPELAGEKRRYTIVPPSIHRDGSKKTVFANVADICKRYDTYYQP